ncbi:hypothetical protein AHAS_Ahas18G0214400 [Arachis hypogaea]
MDPIEGKIISIRPKRNQGLNSDHCNMVEKVITKKEIKFKVCKNPLLGMWCNPEGVAIFEVGRKFLINFSDRRRGMQILDSGPWCIKGNLINLQRWSSGTF